MKREITKRGRNKTQKTQMMHSTIGHHPLTNAQPVPRQQSVGPGQLPSFCVLGMMCCGAECPFG